MHGTTSWKKLEFFIVGHIENCPSDKAITIQQDATEYSLFKSVNCSTSGDHSTVSTVSDINETGIATCRERGRTSSHVQVSLKPDTVDTVSWDPDDGWNTTRNMLSSWQI